MNQHKRIRVLIAKVGLDGHDKGAMLLASRLRDAGMEVIYSGLRRTVEQIINMAMQEDVDVIGMSILSGSHVSFAQKILDKMKEYAIDEKIFLVGGVIPDDDIPKLSAMGVSGVFTQSASFQEVIDFIHEKILAA